MEVLRSTSYVSALVLLYIALCNELVPFGRCSGMDRNDPGVAYWLQDLSTAINSDVSSSWVAATSHTTEGVRKANLERQKRGVFSPHSYRHIVDWRASGQLRSPDHQGACGSCWAFASTHAFNDRLNIAEWTRSGSKRPWVNPRGRVSLSVQHLAECACGLYECNDARDGCLGAQADTGSKYLTTYGSTHETCKAYLGRGHCRVCRHHCDKNSRPVSRAGLLTFPRYQQIIDNEYSTRRPNRLVKRIQDALSRGPLIAAIMSRADFTQYQSGIYSARGSPISTGGHLIEIVGYGEARLNRETIPYWIIKNSYGRTWGIDGYGYIQAGTDEMKIETSNVIEPVVDSMQHIDRGSRFSFSKRSSRNMLVCQEIAIPGGESRQGEVKAAVDYLNSVVVDLPKMFPGCYHQQRFRSELVNATYQLVEVFLYRLRVKYTSDACPFSVRVIQGTVALGFRTERYSLLRGDVVSSKGPPCACGAPYSRHRG